MTPYWFDLFILLMNLLATVTLAVSGVLQAARSKMDFFGALVLACVTAMGGGSLRDLLIGATPVFWATDLIYLGTILPTTVITIIVVQFITPGNGIRLRVLDVADALGLALFAILGAQKTLEMGLSEPVAVVMGAITGIAGGMIRDVLSQCVPIVLRGKVYASAAIVGTIVYTILRLFLTEVVAMLCSMGLIVSIRLAAVYWGWSFPMLKLKL